MKYFPDWCSPICQMTMNKETEALLELLRSAVNEPENRRRHIAEFQDKVWNAQEGFFTTPEGELFSELAYDLDFYEPDPVRRRESASYFGDDRLTIRIQKALEELRANR